uniref:leucine--tRNA ligase n=1 Tax=Plectus sambesii TaxID=2011161 RepID=A0A914VST0_9BILA
MVRLCRRLLYCQASTSKALLPWPDKNIVLRAQVKNIEAHWKPKLQNLRKNTGPKKYILSMFPYPSGNLHIGHARVYTISDILARYFEMRGCQVIHPMGWDAFGLPAENAAIERKLDPKVWTYRNIETMREQLLQTGCRFDWDREIFTCDPAFYKWTQWIFVKLFEKGLLRRQLTEVNFDPVDNTVLAAEQIDPDGRSWRSGALAEKRLLEQWLVQTTKYAKALLDGLDHLEHWEQVADIQRNWIGKCDVYAFHLPLIDNKGNRMIQTLDLRISDPEQLSSCDFVVVKRSHSLAKTVPDASSDTDVLLNVSLLNVFTGQQLPIVASDKGEFGEFLNARLASVHTCETDKTLADQLRISPSSKKSLGRDQILSIAQEQGVGGYITSRKLLDWVVSRQRYWGTPIPIVHCGKCGVVPVPEDSLPVVLPHVDSVGGSTLKSATEWYNTSCPSCGSPAHRETDTLDTFFDSSWYYLRYLDPHNQQQLISKYAAQNMPVDVYVGGIEHAAVHIFFARFISHFLYDLGVTTTKEPFEFLLPQGIIRGQTFRVPSTGEYVKKEQVESKGSDYFDKKTGTQLEMVYEKMSKSRYNGVDPMDVLRNDGIDLMRLQLVENAAPKSARNWGDDDTRGLEKWFARIFYIVNVYIEKRQALGGNFKPASDAFEANFNESYNYFVRMVSGMLEIFHLHNTAVSRLQGLTNAMRKCADDDAMGRSKEYERCLHGLVIMLSPFAPHIAAELWAALRQAPAIQPNLWKKDQDVWMQDWPSIDPYASIDFAVLVNEVSIGRHRMPRQAVEQLTIESAMKIAESEAQGPADWLKRFRATGGHIKSFSLRHRPQFEAVLNLTVDMAEDDIQELVKKRSKKPTKKTV